MPVAHPATYLELAWTPAVEAKIHQVFAANPRATAANLAHALKVPVREIKRFMEACPDAVDAVEIGRAAGDNAVSQKNFSLALQGDTKAMEREMKKRGMLGNDNGPIMPKEQGRDYSKLTVEELEILAKLDDKTRNGAASEGAVREIAAPLHS